MNVSQKVQIVKRRKVLRRRDVLEKIVSILYYIYVNKHTCVGLRDISRDLHMSLSTVSKYVMLLKEKGLIEVEKKGKKYCLKLTPKGVDAVVVSQRLLGILGLRIE